MQYKTTILEWIQAMPEYHEPLRSAGTLLETLNREAVRLRTIHLGLKTGLERCNPESDSSSTTSTAWEAAFAQWEEEFRSGASPSASDTIPDETGMHPTAD